MVQRGPMKKISNRRGQAMLAAVTVMGVVALIFITAIVYKNSVTQKATVKSGKSSAAHEIANAAIQKGIWALNLNSGNWALLGNGGTLPGYNGDVIYTDMPGGSYKITISAGPNTATDRTITAYAKDNSSSPQYSGLRVVLSKSSAQFGAIMAPKIDLQKPTKVHWGPIYAYDTLDLQKESRNFFPRLYSKGKIRSIDTNPSLPNTDGVQWWSYNFSPGVPAWPQIDLAYYKAQAQAQGRYYAKGDREKSVNHGDDDRLDNDDRDDDDSYTYQNVIDTQPYVRFYDHGVKVKFKGGKNLLRGVIIAMDTVEFKDGPASVGDVNAAYAAAGLPNFYPHTVQLPQNAWKEYAKIDTASGGDYPGDIGGPGASGQNATYTFGASSVDNLHTDAPVHFEGLLYAGKKIKLHRGGTFLGVIMAADKSVKLSGSDEDDDSGDAASCDNDHKSKWTGDDDSDHHDGDPGDLDVHRDHDTDQDGACHQQRLTVYYLDNLGIRIIGSGQKQTLFQEVPSPAF